MEERWVNTEEKSEISGKDEITSENQNGEKVKANGESRSIDD